MSMNLCCKEMELLQTPTYITYLCYFADMDKKKPSPWKTIKEKYVMYLQSVTNKNQDWDWHKEHVEKLNSFKILHFCIG